MKSLEINGCAPHAGSPARIASVTGHITGAMTTFRLKEFLENSKKVIIPCQQNPTPSLLIIAMLEFCYFLQKPSCM